MAKPKPVLSSLREKKRYLAFEIISGSVFPDWKAIANEIRYASAELLGSVEQSKAGILFLPEKYNGDKKRGVIKVNSRYLDSARASLALIKRVGGAEVVIRSLGASGMISKAEQYINDV